MGHYLALSSSGASTAASSDVDAPGPAPTVPRIPKHRPKKLPSSEVRLALLGLAEASNADNDDVGRDEEELEEVFDLNDSHIGHDDDLGDYDLGPVEKRISKHAILDKSSKKVKRRVLYDMEVDRDSSEAESEIESNELEVTKIKNKKKKRLKQVLNCMIAYVQILIYL